MGPPLQAPDLGVLIIVGRPSHLGEFHLSPVKRMQTPSQTPQNLRYWKAPINNLGHRVPLEILGEVALGHLSLLASN